MKKYLIRFLNCLLVIVCMPIWYIASFFIYALFICTVCPLILFIIFYVKTGKPVDSWDASKNTIDIICNFMFIEPSDKIKEFLNNN